MSRASRPAAPRTLTVSATAGVAPGPYTVTVTGTEGGTTHATNVQVGIVAGPDFTLDASPAGLTVPQGTEASSTHQHLPGRLVDRHREPGRGDL